MRKSLILAYMAAYVDGEGCIRLNGNSPTLEVTNTFPNTLLAFRQLFGGEVYRIKKPFQHVRRTAWRYTAYGQNAARAVKTLLPYLREKREQAKVLMRWSATRKGTKKSEQLRARLKALKRIDYVVMPQDHRDYGRQKTTT